MKNNTTANVVEFIDSRISHYETVINSAYKKGLFSKSNEFTFRISELKDIKKLIEENKQWKL